MRVLILLPFLAGCAHQDEWTTGDTVWQGIYTAVLLADCYAANNIQDHPNIIENGEIATMFMGQTPSTESVIGYCLTMGISNYVIARALPRGWRTIWQAGTATRHALAVNEANQLGLFATPCTRHQEEHPCP